MSVDTKKKELIGLFKNAGRTWGRKATEVNAHDFKKDAVGKAVPYGVYDLNHQVGAVFVGDSADTPEFAGAALEAWWGQEGRKLYPLGTPWMILADGGGSNSWRSRNWKKELQEKICDRLSVSVTVCHSPRGCSIGNPIEHRLFGPISLNGSGIPLESFERLIALIRGTTIFGGEVRASRLEGIYMKAKKVSAKEMAALKVEKHETCPNWNSTLHPRLPQAPIPELIT